MKSKKIKFELPVTQPRPGRHYLDGPNIPEGGVIAEVKIGHGFYMADSTSIMSPRVVMDQGLFQEQDLHPEYHDRHNLGWNKPSVSVVDFPISPNGCPFVEMENLLSARRKGPKVCLSKDAMKNLAFFSKREISAIAASASAASPIALPFILDIGIADNHVLCYMYLHDVRGHRRVSYRRVQCSSKQKTSESFFETGGTLLLPGHLIDDWEN